MAVTASRILVLRALGIGDLLTAVPALRGLRRHFPGATITLAAPAALTDLAAEIDAIDQLLPTEGPHELDWTGPPPSLAVNLHGRGPESIELLRRLRPRELLSHAGAGTDGPRWCGDQHETTRWCRLLAYRGVAAIPSDLDLPRPARSGPAPGAVVLHPGASHAARRWPPARYGALAAWLTSHDRHVVVTGAAAERDHATEVARAGGLPEERVLAGRTSPGELAAIAAHAELVVCGDTGMAHLATAYGTPSVVLFGPVSPHHWGPPPSRSQHRALWSGGVGDPFAARPDPGLLRITVDDVVDAVKETVRETPRTTQRTNRGSNRGGR